MNKKASMDMISYREDELNMHSIYEPSDKLLDNNYNNSSRYYKDIMIYLKEKIPRNTIRTIEVLPSIVGGCYVADKGAGDLLSVSFMSCTPESDLYDRRGNIDIFQLFKDKTSFSFADYEEYSSSYKKYAIAWGKFKGMEHFNDSRRGYNIDYINKFKNGY